MTIEEWNERRKKGEPVMRSCWNCNSAHKHLKKADYIIFCFECGSFYFKGKKITKLEGEKKNDKTI
jgi:hypothetical protein